MRFLKSFPIAGLVLMAGFLAGCGGEPPRMKNQPTNPNSVDTKLEMPGKKKTFDVAK
jgi:hypothetical protein